MSVKVIDKGWKRIEKELQKAHGAHVKVGFPEEKPKIHKPKDGENSKPIDMAQLASVLNFGTTDGRIPPRPFISETLDLNLDAVTETIEKIKSKIFEGKLTASKGLAQLGAYYKGLMQRTIREEVWQANAESTIAKKGSSTPLIDTSQLRQSVDFEVVEGKK